MNRITKEDIKKRNTIVQGIRNFFNSKDYLEVETPVLSPYLLPESNIEAFETTYYSYSRGTQQLYLTPSPEIFMKKLIAEGYGDIFQITKSFRNNEQMGRDHNPEFTMLEWYKMNVQAADNIPVTEELFAFLLNLAEEKNTSNRDVDTASLKPPFRRITMEEIFFAKTGIDLTTVQNFSALTEAALKKGYTLADRGETWETIFNRIFIQEVEPYLPVDRPLIIYNYPAKIECLAKNIPQTPWKDRWELYVGGIELANCYTEEINKKKVASILEQEYLRKAACSKVIPDFDNSFSNLFSDTYSPCSGVALGVDRLVRMFTGKDSLGGVILFPLSDII